MAERPKLIQRISPVARLIAQDLGVEDVRAVQEALRRRAPGMAALDARIDGLSRDQYDDLCDAVEAELRRPERAAGEA